MYFYGDSRVGVNKFILCCAGIVWCEYFLKNTLILCFIFHMYGRMFP